MTKASDPQGPLVALPLPGAHGPRRPRRPHGAIVVASGLLARLVLTLLVLTLVVVVVVVAGAAPAAAGPPAGRTYRPPVDAPVIDPFRLPPEPWMAGNRGIEYATVPGTPVRAIGPGVVAFAGPVAGARYVTVRHPDGLRSSYSYLAAIRVTVGQVVSADDPVGVAGDRFHVGVRRVERYLDPASLWGTPVGGGRVVLVPVDDRGSGSADASVDASVATPPDRDGSGPNDSRARRRSLVDAGVGLSATAAVLATSTSAAARRGA